VAEFCCAAVGILARIKAQAGQIQCSAAGLSAEVELYKIKISPIETELIDSRGKVVVMRVLVTGAAGFIGFHLSRRLLERGDEVIGYDCLNSYYSVALKKARLEQLHQWDGFSFVEGDLIDAPALDAVFATDVTHVVNLAAQAGVRHSLEHPRDYTRSNVSGFLNVLEGCRGHDVQHLVYASSSSVYGLNRRLPHGTGDRTDHPVSLYGASKKANEVMAHSYSHLFGIPTTGLRFFSVYGPWGRPDMAAYLFTEAIFAGRPIKVFNHGRMRRSFTYVDDIVEGVLRVLLRPPVVDGQWPGPEAAPDTSSAPYRLYNIGNDQGVELGHYIGVIEDLIGREAVKEYMPMQPGDVKDNSADITALERDVGYRPTTPVEEGLRRFVEWYRQYHNC
jgi:UDP-glucuronate 4-epimerase